MKRSLLISQAPTFTDGTQLKKFSIVSFVDWSRNIFTEANIKQDGETFTLPIRQAAMDVLERTDRQLVIDELNSNNLEKVTTISEFFQKYPHEDKTPAPIVNVEVRSPKSRGNESFTQRQGVCNQFSLGR